MSKKTLRFTLDLTFESEINDDNDIMVVAANVARAIIAETNGLGISPQNGDTYLEELSIKPQYLDTTITLKVID